MVSVISNAEFYILTPHVQRGHLQDICPGFGFSDGVRWFISMYFFSLQHSTLGPENFREILLNENPSFGSINDLFRKVELCPIGPNYVSRI